jgi:predicted Zn-dependent protease
LYFVDNRLLSVIFNIMKKIKFLLIIFLCGVLFLTCETDPLTGKTTLALIPNSVLFPSAFSQYTDFLNESTVIRNGSEAQMVERLGVNIKNAAEKWYASIGKSNYLRDYEWEYKLVQDDQVNAWCMPGGKIVVYTGILPLFKNNDGSYNESMLAVVMGHEVSHALLNHGQQRVSLNLLTQLGLVGAQITLGLFTTNPLAQELLMTGLGITTTLGVALPFSRENESEADEYGLYLTAIAGYDPEESVPFWEKMAAMSGNTPEILSTHPAPKTRINNLKKLVPEAKKRAAKLHIDAIKDSIPKAKKIAAEINGQ